MESGAVIHRFFSVSLEMATHLATDAYEQFFFGFFFKLLWSNCLLSLFGRQRQPSAWKMLKLSLQSRSSDKENRWESFIPNPEVEVKENISCCLGSDHSGVVLFGLVTFESIFSGHMEEVGRIKKLMINLYKASIVEGAFPSWYSLGGRILFW